MALIQIPDDKAAALQAKAAAQGISLEEWLRNLAGLGVAPRRKRKYNLQELVAQCDPSAPLSEEDEVWLNDPATGREAI